METLSIKTESLLFTKALNLFEAIRVRTRFFKIALNLHVAEKVLRFTARQSIKTHAFLLLS